jgi:hypothetical protein
MVNMWNINTVREVQENTHNKVKVKVNSEFRSLTSSLTWSLGPLCLQIDVYDAYDLRFG